MLIETFIKKWLPTATKISEYKYKAHCPNPRHPGGNDKTPSLEITQFQDTGKIGLYCFPCMGSAKPSKEDRNQFLNEIANTFSDPEAFKRDCNEGFTEEERPNTPKRKKTQEEYDADEAKTWGDYTLDEYATSKHLDKDFLKGHCGVYEDFRISYEGAKGLMHGKKRGVIMPYWSVYQTLIEYRQRTLNIAENNIKVRDTYKPKNRPANKLIYGMWLLPTAFKDKSFIFIVEGESDCHTLWENGFCALGIPGAGRIPNLDEAYEQWQIDCYMSKFEKIYLVTEDPDGAKLFDACKGSKYHTKTFCVKFRPDISTKERSGKAGDCKDPNELFCALNGDKAQFIKEMQAIIDAATPIDEFVFPYPKKKTKGNQTTLDFDGEPADKRSQTSPENGKKGGRPKANIAELAKYLFSLETISCYRFWRKNVYKRITEQNKYIKCTEQGFTADVTAELQKIENTEISLAFGYTDFNMATLNNAISYLKSRNYLQIPDEITPGHFISRPNDEREYIAVQNGILDISISEAIFAHYPHREQIDLSKYFYPPTPDFFNLQALETTFNINAENDVYETILSTIQPQNENRELIYTLFGLSLTQNRNSNKVFFFDGEGGTGKSTVLDTLAFLHGDTNIGAINVEDLSAKNGTFILGDLVKYTVNVCEEAPSEQHEIAAFLNALKRYTGGSVQQINIKYEEPISARIKALIILTSNFHVFVTYAYKTADTAFLDRLILIPFAIRLRDTPQEDKNIKEKIKQDCLQGILIRSLAALGQLRLNKYVLYNSETGLKRLEEIKEEAKTTLDFFFDTYTYSDTTSIALEELYKQYGIFTRNFDIFDQRCVQRATFERKLKIAFPKAVFTLNENQHKRYINLTRIY